MLLFSSQLLGGAGPGGLRRPGVAKGRMPGLGRGDGVSGIWRRLESDGCSVFGFTSDRDSVGSTEGA